MFKIKFILPLISCLALFSCKKCIECTYSYTETKTEFGVNGEETYTDTIRGQLLPDDNGTPEGNTCGDQDEVDKFRTRYENGNSEGEYENYDYNCIEQ